MYFTVVKSGPSQLGLLIQRGDCIEVEPEPDEAGGTPWYGIVTRQA